ncbi:hypothetical protein QZH41_002530 [Actinostola sp. cb2023]|nr:hypothetical protein QZH41_002530 [Actinostola sp. cb2023]
MSGVWERLIRSVKRTMKAILGEKTVDEEVLRTVLSEAQAITNSRPLCPNSDDPRDMEAITPNHLLLQRTVTTMPPGCFDDNDLVSRKKWRQSQILAEHYWKRWLREYLPTLQQRQKWHVPRRNLEIDDLVLVADDNVQRGNWPLGRVMKVIQGRDGRVRSAEIKTKSTVLHCPITKLCLLEATREPPQYKLDPRLARLMGIHTQTRPVIVNAIWQYIKSHNLQDAHEREYINNDRYFKQIFETERMKFSEIPQRLSQLLMPPDPIVINHLINKEVPENKRVTCYDIDVEVDDTLKAQMQSFLLSTASQNEITTYDNKIYETVETINNLKINREFFLGFARDPQEFINKWVQSQSQDLKVMTDVVGNPEQERRADFYYLPWSQEAVCRYFYSKVQQKRAELEQALGIRGT